MRKIFLLTASCLLLSACTLSNQPSSPLPEKEATSADDKEILKAFDQDKDTDFSTEFKQLDTDLQ